MTQARLDIAAIDDRIRLFGEFDGALGALEQLSGAAVTTEGDSLIVTGDDDAVARARRILARMISAAASGEFVSASFVREAAAEIVPPSKREPVVREGRAAAQALATTRRGRPVRARTDGQRAFVDAIGANTLTLAIGPAGTGKTFLAVVMAVAALRAGDVQRIVLSRPAVEAGESLGFLPGDFQAKVDPYLRPLFDALGEIMEPQAVTRAVERGQIEVAPLAYMRGRTLSDAFVVLDEAQNASRDQMKMFLTRIGAHSRMVVCGDVTQIDLARRQDSGLVHAATAFAGIDDVALVHLTESDVVRHPLIKAIIKAYDRAGG